MTIPAHALSCWRAPVRRRTHRERGERTTPSTSTLRLPGLRAWACSGLTLSGASLPRLKRRGLAPPNGSTAKKAVKGFKSMNQTPDQRCKFDEWLLNNSLNLHLEYLKITGDITDGSDPFFHFIHLPVNGLQDTIHLR